MPGGFLASAVKNYEYRRAQMEMAEAVAGALDRRATLLVESATGTGKTWAYLIPAILSGKKVIISTGTKTLQDQLYLKDLPFLAQHLPLQFTFGMMKGKSNYLCLYRFAQSQQQPAFQSFEAESHWGKVQQWTMRTATGDRSEMSEIPETAPLWQEVTVKGEDCLGTQCPSYDRCYLTRMRQTAAASDIIIVNHHLFFADLALKGVSYGEILPHYDAAIFDEAHLLEEVATHYFGASISSHRIEDFIEDAEREFRFSQVGDPISFQQCKNVRSEASLFFHLFRKREERYRLESADFSPEVLSAGERLLQSLQLLRWHIGGLRLKSEGISHLSERIEVLASDLQLFLTEEERAKEYVYWAERRKQGLSLYASPLDVSEILRERLFQRDIPLVLTSATLRALSSQDGFGFIRERLGIDEAEEQTLTTPFDYERQALIYLPDHLPNPSSPHFTSAVSEEMIRILNESGGRAFLLFTSWKNMEEVYQKTAGRLRYPLLKQGDQPKQALIDAFRRHGASVLFGTTSFWQGVDVPGEALSCVIIDKLPFASPSDPLTAARIDFLVKKNEDPFTRFQLPSAILSLRQGIGRLIRTKEDRGLIAILDHRLMRKEYGKFFLRALPPSRRTSSFEEVQAFFSA